VSCVTAYISLNDEVTNLNSFIQNGTPMQKIEVYGSSKHFSAQVSKLVHSSDTMQVDLFFLLER
jgi:hypothetical protein